MKKYFSILFFVIGISMYAHAQDTLKYSPTFDPTAPENSKINLDSVAKKFPEGITRSSVCCVGEFVYKKAGLVLVFEDYDFGYKINGNEVSKEEYFAVKKKLNI